jgi:transposase InsO family protein
VGVINDGDEHFAGAMDFESFLNEEPFMLYRLCIEEGLLTRSQIADTTFRRMVKQYELLKPDAECSTKIRLAFSKAHANEMWQADTLIGPYIQHEGSSVQTRLIAFLDDASRVCCHGQFFLAENVDTLIEALRAAFYKRGIPQSLYVDNGSIYSPKEIFQICARVGCLLHHTPVRDGAAKGKIERFFRTLETIYRLRRRLQRGLDQVRTRLCRELPPPVSQQSQPLLQTVEHLRATFPASGCPPADFQLHFQHPFLG